MPSSRPQHQPWPLFFFICASKPDNRGKGSGFLLWYKGIVGVRRITVMRSTSKWIVSLCLLLTLWSAVAVAVHHHSDADEAVRCTVCVAAHSTAPQLPVLLPRLTFVTVSTFKAEPVVSPKQRLIAFALSVRPPPES